MKERRLMLYIAASLDGYIATADEDLEWLLSVEGEGDNGFSEFYDTVDTILLGRKTYDWIMTHEGQNFPYKGKECYVFSRTPHDRTEHVTFLSEDAVSFAASLKNKPGKAIWLVGGGLLLDEFLRRDAINEIILNIAPALLGKGIPLFHSKDMQTALTLKSVRRFGQFVELHYTVNNK